MLTLHHLNRSRSQRVLWMLEELEIPYEIVRHERDPKTFLAPPALAEIHPLGKAPVIVDGEHTVAESGAILEYLAEHHGQGRFIPPAGTPQYERYRYFMHYAEGSLMPPLLVAFLAERIASAPVPFFVRPIVRKIAGTLGTQYVEPNLRRHVDFVDDALGQSKWFSGDELTAADIQMSYPVETLLHRASPLADRKRIRDFVDRIHARPAYQRAIEKGGPFEPA